MVRSAEQAAGERRDATAHHPGHRLSSHSLHRCAVLCCASMQCACRVCSPPCPLQAWMSGATSGCKSHPSWACRAVSLGPDGATRTRTRTSRSAFTARTQQSSSHRTQQTALHERARAGLPWVADQHATLLWMCSVSCCVVLCCMPRALVCGSVELSSRSSVGSLAAREASQCGAAATPPAARSRTLTHRYAACACKHSLTHSLTHSLLRRHSLAEDSRLPARHAVFLTLWAALCFVCRAELQLRAGVRIGVWRRGVAGVALTWQLCSGCRHSGTSAWREDSWRAAAAARRSERRWSAPSASSCSTGTNWQERRRTGRWRTCLHSSERGPHKVSGGKWAVRMITSPQATVPQCLDVLRA